jgi:hypothetical protein
MKTRGHKPQRYRATLARASCVPLALAALQSRQTIEQVGAACVPLALAALLARQTIEEVGAATFNQASVTVANRGGNDIVERTVRKQTRVATHCQTQCLCVVEHHSVCVLSNTTEFVYKRKAAAGVFHSQRRASHQSRRCA